jgi:hypothetical protein
MDFMGDFKPLSEPHQNCEIESVWLLQPQVAASCPRVHTCSWSSLSISGKRAVFTPYRHTRLGPTSRYHQMLTVLPLSLRLICGLLVAMPHSATAKAELEAYLAFHNYNSKFEYYL